MRDRVIKRGGNSVRKARERDWLRVGSVEEVNGRTEWHEVKRLRHLMKHDPFFYSGFARRLDSGKQNLGMPSEEGRRRKSCKSNRIFLQHSMMALWTKIDNTERYK